MIEYCAGFFFDPRCERVWLIRKNRPGWQAGRLNAIGGKAEPGETFTLDAMVREFREETGLAVGRERWRWVCDVLGYANSHRVAFFAAVAHDEAEYRQPGSMTDEMVGSFHVAGLWRRRDLVGNLRLELALALAANVRPAVLREARPQDYRSAA